MSILIAQQLLSLGTTPQTVLAHPTLHRQDQIWFDGQGGFTPGKQSKLSRLTLERVLTVRGTIETAKALGSDIATEG